MTMMLLVLMFNSAAASIVEIALMPNGNPSILSVTEPTYASWNVDSSCNRGFHHINFSNPNLIAAAKGLRPSKLRFGGSGNDNLVYGLTPGSPECSSVKATDCGYVTPGCLNASHWLTLYGLARESQSDFIFGVAYGLQQACQEGSSYEWNSSNADALLDYMRAQGQQIWGFELGNEVNNNGDAPCNQTPPQQARAQLKFTEMVNSKLPHALLIGPDTGGRDPEPWLRSYLPFVKSPGLHAVTHHVYAGITRDNFFNVSRLDGSTSEILWYTSMLRELAPGAQVWAGEDGPTGGGNDGTCGQGSACGTYATTLWYADDLGLRAKHGFVQYQRQDLIGGHYGLTNTISTEQVLGSTDPLVLRPDYWVNFLWKRTLGRSVLNASSSSASVRAYAFLGSPPSPFAAPECAKSLQLLLINVNKDNSIHVDHLPALSGLTDATYSLWTLTSSQDDPFSEQVLLNGVLLPSNVNVARNASAAAFLDQIPEVAIQKLAKGGVTLPPLSTSFLCLSSQTSPAIVV